LSDIFQEVDEDLRREQITRLWKKYGIQAIGAFAVTVLIAAGIVGWKSYHAARAREASLKYQEIVRAGEAATPESPEERLAALDKIEGDLTPGYKLLARFERAAALVEAKRPAEAAKMLDAIAADTSIDETLRNTAQLKAALLLADTLSLSDMKSRLDKLAAPESAFRFLADELLGYAAFRVGDLTAARNYYLAITSDLSAPAGIQQRAQDMLDEVDQRLPPRAVGAKPAPAPPAGSKGPSPETNAQSKP